MVEFEVSHRITVTFDQTNQCLRRLAWRLHDHNPVAYGSVCIYLFAHKDETALSWSLAIGILLLDF